MISVCIVFYYCGCKCLYYITQVSRLNLYYRLGKQYNEKKLYVENIIEGNRTKLGSVQYQHWFKRNYPVFTAEVEGIILYNIVAFQLHVTPLTF